MMTKGCLRLVFVLTSIVAAGGPTGSVNARPVTVTDLAGLVDIGGHQSGAIEVSPDGKWVAFQLQRPDFGSNSYDLEWMIVAADGASPPRPLGDGGDPILNPDKYASTNGNRGPVRPLWAPDSESIFYLKKSDGEVQLWRSWIADGKQEQLTRHDRDVMHLALSDDGARLFHTLARPRDAVAEELARESVRGYLVDDRIRPFSERWPTRRFCGNGWWQAVSLERQCVPAVAVYELASGQVRPATDGERARLGGGAMHGVLGDLDASPESGPGWKSTRPVVLWARAPGDGDYAWLETGDPTAGTARLPESLLHVGSSADDERACGHPACRGHHFAGLWWGNDGRLYFLRRDGASGSRHGFYEWDTRSGEVRAILTTEDALSDCSVRSTHAICLHEGPTSPRRIVALELGTGSLETIFDPNPDFSGLEFTRIELMEWEDEFGNPAHGRLVYPRGYEAGKRYPLVVTPYSSRGFMRGDVGDEFPIHAFAAAGLMVLDMNAPFDVGIPAPGESAMERSERDLRRRRSTFSSLVAALAQLDERGLIDMDLVGMTGLSDGAQQVHYAVINSDLVAAASVSGLVTPEFWYLMDAPMVREQLRGMWGGGPDSGSPGYAALSYRQNLDKVDAAILINVSDEEYLVSNQEFAALQDAGKKVEMHLFPNEHHIKWKPRHRLSIYLRNLQWFQFWLMGVEADDPVDPGQYARWRSLRGD